MEHFPRVGESKAIFEDFVTVLDRDGSETRMVLLFEAVVNSACSFGFNCARKAGGIARLRPALPPEWIDGP